MIAHVQYSSAYVRVVIIPKNKITDVWNKCVRERERESARASERASEREGGGQSTHIEPEVEAEPIAVFPQAAHIRQHTSAQSAYVRITARAIAVFSQTARSSSGVRGFVLLYK
jgi:hypothetical protein